MIGFLDLPSGLSGDMLLGALVDGGWPVARLQSILVRLHLATADCLLDAQSVMKGALRATQVVVRTKEAKSSRHLHDIREIIVASDLPNSVKTRAEAVFVRLANAEAKVHGTTPEKIHFHEVGALDAIVDIVGAVWGLHELHVETLHAAAPPLGEGWAQTMHGRVPLPAPATLELLAAVGAPTQPAPGPGEWLTPTGAALLAELADFTQPSMRLERIGIGAGQRDCSWPNVARLWLGQPLAEGPMIQIETNIDDMNPQLYDAVSQRLLALGARDVWLTPVQMKKGRPAVVLSTLAPAACEQALCDVILRETTTLGLRLHAVRRHEARRAQRQIHTCYGNVSVKLKWVDHELVGVTPEYDDCVALASKNHLSVREVYEAALASAHDIIRSDGNDT